MSRKELSMLITLALVQFTHILDGMIMMPMAPNLRESFGINSQQFGFLVSSYGLSAFVSAIIATFWLDKFDRKRVLAVLYAGFWLGTLACAFAPTYEFFIAARIFTGFFGGVAGAVIQSIVGDVVAPERRAQGMGILMTGFALAAVAGIPLGIFLSEQFSWQMPFLLICGIGVPVFIGIIVLLPNVRGHLQNPIRQSPLDFYRSVLANGNQIKALSLTLAMTFAHFSIIPYLSDYFVNNLHYDMKSEVIFVYIVGGVLSTFTSPLWGRLADKYGRFKIYLVLNMLALIPIISITNFHSHSMLLLLPVTTMLFIFSGGRMIPAQAIITSTVEMRQRGSFMSLNSAMQQLAMGMATLIGGLIIVNDAQGLLYNYQYVGYIGVAFTFLAVLLASRIKEEA